MADLPPIKTDDRHPMSADADTCTDDHLAKILDSNCPPDGLSSWWSVHTFAASKKKSAMGSPGDDITWSSTHRRFYGRHVGRSAFGLAGTDTRIEGTHTVGSTTAKLCVVGPERHCHSSTPRPHWLEGRGTRTPPLVKSVSVKNCAGTDFSTWFCFSSIFLQMRHRFRWRATSSR